MTVTKIEYGDGNPGNRYVGRIALVLQHDEWFEASYQHRDQRRSWRGALVAGTFARAVGVLRACGFPRSEPLGNLVPGTSITDLGWEDNGAWQRIRYPDTAATYHPFVAIVSTIMSVLDGQLARMPPGASSVVASLEPDSGVDDAPRGPNL
jgi:hypothetical protein